MRPENLMKIDNDNAQKGFHENYAMYGESKGKGEWNEEHL